MTFHDVMGWLMVLVTVFSILAVYVVEKTGDLMNGVYVSFVPYIIMFVVVSIIVLT